MERLRIERHFSGSVSLKVVDNVNVGGAASAGKQFKLPSVNESRELIQARKDMLAPRRVCLSDCCRPRADDLAAADTVLPRANTIREYPPPVSAYLQPSRTAAPDAA